MQPVAIKEECFDESICSTQLITENFDYIGIVQNTHSNYVYFIVTIIIWQFGILFTVFLIDDTSGAVFIMFMCCVSSSASFISSQ